MQFNKEELESVKIEDTKVSAKGDDTIYAAFGDLETVKDIQWIIAEIRDSRLSIRNYIPPQLWERYMYLNRECTSFRKDNPNTKTQLRFGIMDIEVWVKTKGTAEPYRTVTLETITDPENIQRFDHIVSWKQQKERVPRRKLVRAMNASTRMEMENCDMSGPNQSLTNLLRQRLTDSNFRMEKKQRLSAKSSGSGISGIETE